MTPPDANIPHDKPEQLEKVLAGLIDGEQVLAVYDCTGAGTGFLAVTSLRVIIQDKSFVGGRTAVTSLPLRSISSVSFVADKSAFGRFLTSATVAFTVGSSTHEATFRGEDKARHVHDAVLTLVTRS
ncbi:PH domain-containing protein [Cellulomonas sp. URHB0016]